MWRNLRERRREIRDESQDGLPHAAFPVLLMRQEPIPIVIALEAGEKTEKIGTKISGH